MTEAVRAAGGFGDRRCRCRDCAGTRPAAPPPPDAVTPAHDRAEAIVCERYAAGEIDDDELHHRLRVLRSESVND